MHESGRQRVSVFGAHITMADSMVGHIEVIWTSEVHARAHAMRRSRDPGVLYAVGHGFHAG